MTRRQRSAGVPGRPHGRERPDPDADEVAAGFQSEAVRRVGSGDLEPPAQRVRQEALGPEVHDLAESALVAGLGHADAQVDRRPPAGEPRRVTQDLGDLLAGPRHLPGRHEVIRVVGHQRPVSGNRPARVRRSRGCHLPTHGGPSNANHSSPAAVTGPADHPDPGGLFQQWRRLDRADHRAHGRPDRGPRLPGSGIGRAVRGGPGRRRRRVDRPGRQRPGQDPRRRR